MPADQLKCLLIFCLISICGIVHGQDEDSGPKQTPIAEILKGIDRYEMDFFEFYETVESLEKRAHVSKDSIALVILKYFLGEEYIQSRDSAQRSMIMRHMEQQKEQEQLRNVLNEKEELLTNTLTKVENLESQADLFQRSVWKTYIISNNLSYARLGAFYDLSLLIITGKKRFIYLGPMIGYKENLENELPFILGLQGIIPISVSRLTDGNKRGKLFMPNLFVGASLYTSNFFFKANESAGHIESGIGRVFRSGTWGGKITIGYSPNSRYLIGLNALYEKFVGNNDPVFFYSTEFSIGLGAQVSFLF